MATQRAANFFCFAQCISHITEHAESGRHASAFAICDCCGPSALSYRRLADLTLSEETALQLQHARPGLLALSRPASSSGSAQRTQAAPCSVKRGGATGSLPGSPLTACASRTRVSSSGSGLIAAVWADTGSDGVPTAADSDHLQAFGASSTGCRAVSESGDAEPCLAPVRARSPLGTLSGFGGMASGGPLAASPPCAWLHARVVGSQGVVTAGGKEWATYTVHVSDGSSEWTVSRRWAGARFPRCVL